MEGEDDGREWRRPSVKSRGVQSHVFRGSRANRTEGERGDKTKDIRKVSAR